MLLLAVCIVALALQILYHADAFRSVKLASWMARNQGTTRLKLQCSIPVQQNKDGSFGVTIDIGEKTYSFETGRIGRQANGAVMARVEDTIVYSTACYNPVAEPVDFTPLKVDYFSRYSAAGKTIGSFLRRDSRGDDTEIIISRLIDRPLRPMIVDGWQHDTQVLAWLLSYDKKYNPEPLAICAASAAMAISEVPLLNVVSAVEIGLVENKLTVNPTKDQMDRSSLKMVVAGTKSSILMIEGSSNFLPESQLIEAIRVAHEAIITFCLAIEKLQHVAGKQKRKDLLKHIPSSLLSSMDQYFGEGIKTALQISNKQQRGKAMSQLEEKIKTFFGTTSKLQINHKNFDQIPSTKVASMDNNYDGNDIMEKVDSGAPAILNFDEDEDVPIINDNEDTLHPATLLEDEASELTGRVVQHQKCFDEVDIKRATKRLIARKLRELIMTTGLRSDGRNATEIRPLTMHVGLLPCAHGSALFTRGETQALATATLGQKSMEAKYENINEFSSKRFYLQYRFPPSSVGEVGRVGGLSRREVGHGNLAERALVPAMPDYDVFPYTIRAESLITESCGSSSMATVCSCSLAMLEAGIPLKSPIAGIAMGLLLGEFPTEKPIILSDILGLEDALGTMDFKVAGNEDGVTTFQLDIKAEGLTIEMLQNALEQARSGRRYILEKMKDVIVGPKSLKSSVPKILKFSIPMSSIGKVIGSKGKTISQLIETHEVSNISIGDDGSIVIDSFSEEQNFRAKEAIMNLLSQSDEVGMNVEGEGPIRVSKPKFTEIIPDPVIGKIYKDCEIKSVQEYGVFVEVYEGFEALVHVSELSIEYLDHPTRGGFQVGQRLDCQCIGRNERGQWRFSRRSLIQGKTDAPSSNNGVARVDTRRPKPAIQQSQHLPERNNDHRSSRAHQQPPSYHQRSSLPATPPKAFQQQFGYVSTTGGGSYYYDPTNS